MMTLFSCEKDNYFFIEELWFYYKQMEFYNEKGLLEGEIIYVNDKDEESITVVNNKNYLKLPKEDALNIYGNIPQKSLVKGYQKQLKIT